MSLLFVRINNVFVVTGIVWINNDFVVIFRINNIFVFNVRINIVFVVIVMINNVFVVSVRINNVFAPLQDPPWWR